MLGKNIKQIFSIGISIVLIAASTVTEAKDSTALMPSTTKPAGAFILDTGESGIVYANPGQAGATTTWATTSRRCPTGYTAKANYAPRAGDRIVSYMRGISLNCGQPNPITYNVYCIDARLVSPSNNSTGDAWIVITWIITCVPT